MPTCRDRKKTIEKLFKKKHGEPQPLPVAEYEQGEDWCRDCDGNGRIDMEICTACEGEGGHCCDKCDREHECGACDGDGRVGGTRCKVCKGEKRIWQDTKIKYEPLTLAAHYEKRVRALPGVQWALQDDGKCAWFGFEGGEVLLMPLDTSNRGSY